MTNLTEMLSKFITSNTASSSNLPSQTVTNPREHVNAITTRSGKTCEGPLTPLVPTPVVSIPSKEPEQNSETSMDKVQKPSSESTAQIPPLEEEDSIFIEIPKPKAKKIVNIEIQEPNSPKPTSYQLKLPYPERMKLRRNQENSYAHWPLQELDRTSALADSGASINLLPHSIYKQLGLGSLTPTRMTLELANHSITHPMGIAEDVVVRVNGFTFLADFVVVNFEPDPRVPIILRRPFLRTAKAHIDLYEETLTLRVGKEELVYYADKSEKNKDKHFVHAISVIDFSKDDPFSGRTTTHSDDPSPSSSTVKTSDNLEKFTDELTPLNSLPPGDDVSILKKDSQEGNFQVHSNPLFEFDDNFKSSTINPLFDEMEEDVEIENSNEPVLLQTPLSDKGECFDPGDDIDEIDVFLAMEISMDYEEGYYDSEGDVLFLESLLCEDTTHNFASEVISDHDTSISFSPRSDPLHHEFAGELLTLPSRNDREHEDYLNRMTLLSEISISRSQENVHANPSSIIESLPVSLIPVEDSEPVQEEIDIFLVTDDLIPPGVENDDSEDEDNEFPNLDHQDDPSIPRPPPEPPDVEKCLEPEAGILITKVLIDRSSNLRNFWDIPVLNDICYGWRKILQCRDVLREHIVYRIGDGSQTSLWYDDWLFLGPLSQFISKRDVLEAGLSLNCKVCDMVENGDWKWPDIWRSKLPFLFHLPPPLIIHGKNDMVLWKSNDGKVGNFLVKAVWSDLSVSKPSVPWPFNKWLVAWFKRKGFEWYGMVAKVEDLISLRIYMDWTYLFLKIKDILELYGHLFCSHSFDSRKEKEISEFEPDAPVLDNFNKLNEYQRGNEIIFLQNIKDDDSFTFVIRTFLLFLTYPKASPLSCSTRSEDTIFDPGIITFPFSYLQPVAFSMEVSCCSP
ncbi:reverse transcriptase domain-containing protein [Tanacetum coccineum]